jgi:NADH-quinone oxidoreductase subunit J
LVTIGAAFMVITSRNPVHSVLFLILSFFSSAGLFVLIGAEFVAMILVIVYVGAVAVLFLFVVMMLDIDFSDLRSNLIRYGSVGGVVGGVLLLELVFGFWFYWNTDATQLAPPKSATPDPSEVTNAEALGRILYTDYVYLFQASGVILLVAMVGAIVLTLRSREGVLRQNIKAQVDLRPTDVIEVRKVGTGEGV